MDSGLGLDVLAPWSPVVSELWAWVVWGIWTLSGFALLFSQLGGPVLHCDSSGPTPLWHGLVPNLVAWRRSGDIACASVGDWVGWWLVDLRPEPDNPLVVGSSVCCGRAYVFLGGTCLCARVTLLRCTPFPSLFGWLQSLGLWWCHGALLPWILI